MLLTSAEIQSKKIVENAADTAKRATTYDATVGSIIVGGGEIDTSDYKLQPRGIVWVVSSETFNVPEDVTGLATLKTSWTHNGILALNVGVVDPCWHGPLAAAVVNFSDSDFVITKGDTFFRLLFLGHASVTKTPVARQMDVYKKEIREKSRVFSKTFLNIEKVAAEVSEKVFALPKWIYNLTIVGFLIAFLSIFVPLAVAVWSDYRLGPAKFEALQKQIDKLDPRDSTKLKIDELAIRVSELEKTDAPKTAQPTPSHNESQK